MNRFDFAAAFAHDVKHHVMIAEELARNLVATSPEQLKIVTRLERTLKRILVETNSVILAGKCEHGTLEASLLESSLNEVVSECLEEFRILFDSAERTLIFSPGENIPPVNLDPALLPSLINNLLDNALKYGVSSAPVVVQTRQQDSDVVLSVSSTGEPLSQEESKHLFKPFIRGTNAAGKPGSGLGLYIASEIASAQGGELRVAQCGTEQTVFELLLPITD